jgi:hypothetical protein
MFFALFFHQYTVLDQVPITVIPNQNEEGGPKILCMVYTMEAKHATNIRGIRETWASHCDGFLAFSTASDPRIPAISLPHDGPEEYTNSKAFRKILVDT